MGLFGKSDRDPAFPGFFERLRIAISPDYLVKREHARYLAQMIDIESKRAAFKAAETNRLNENWLATGESINTFLKRELSTMRNRSRWLMRNTPTAISAMNAFISYCVGTGIKPISTVYDKIPTKDQDGKDYFEQVDNEIFNEQNDDLWDEWQRNVDISGTDTSPVSFTDVEELVLRKVIEDGEAFVLAKPDKRNPVVPLYVQFFEPETLDDNKTEGNNGNPVTMGVELNKITSRPVGYWVNVSVTENGVTKTKSVRYDARFVFHVFKRMRPGQVRGYPWMHGVMEKFFQLDGYEDAELTACKIAACFSVWFERKKGVNSTGDILPGDSTGSQAEDSDGNKISHIQPGIIGSFPYGSQPHFAQPQKPGATFGMFTEHVDRKIGAGIENGLSYEALTRNTSKASYAGGRLATQRDYQAFRQIIKFMTDHFCMPFRHMWQDMAVTSGAIEAKGYYDIVGTRTAKYYRRHEWIPPAWQYGVNPKDDVSASRDAMRAGMSTLDMECQFIGRDWRSILRSKKKVQDAAERLGLVLTSDASISITNGVQESRDTESTDEQEQETAGAAALEGAST